MSDPAEDDATPPEDIRELVMRTGLSWGNADLLALGPQDTLERLGEFAAYFAFASDREEGGPATRGVRVILPPLRSESADDSLAALKSGFEAGVAKAFAGKAPPGTAETAYPWVNLVSMLTFDGASLLDLIGRPGARTAMIVGEACHYQLPQVTPGQFAGPALDEDGWSVQVHALLVRAEEIVRLRESYVLFDLGACLPARASNIELLCSVGDVGVNGVTAPGKTAEEVVAQVERLRELAARGELGRAVAEIDADPGLTEKMRLFLRLEALLVAGARPQVREMLRGMGDMIPGMAPDQALGVARVAEEVDDDDLAETILNANVGLLRSRRDLERAFSIAASTGRRSLVVSCREALRALHPGSALLRTHDANEAARRGEYAAAARRLATGDGRIDEARRVLFDILDRHVAASVGWQPATLLAEIGARVPDLRGEAMAHVRRALERVGRREEALSLALAGGPPASEGEVLAALALGERSLRAGDAFFDEGRLVEVIGFALDLMGRMPTSGSVRLGLARMSSPTTSARGTAALIRMVLSRAADPPSLRSRPSIDDRPRALDVDEVTSLTIAVARWFSERSGGVFGPQYHALPPSMLPIPAEPLIAGIVQAVDFLGSRVADASDRRALEMYVAVAVTVAPYSPEPDDDLTVIRTVGVRCIVAGLGQFARDIAELALTVAGDRPERRRRALYTFADIYARLGMRVEALVGLASALGIDAPITWDDVWAESSLLFRLLRDFGLIELALPLLERAREALELLGVVARYGHRLDTFELQAGMAAFLRDEGTDAALLDLVEAATANAATVLERNDELLPIGTLLTNVGNVMSRRRLDIPESVGVCLARLNEALPDEGKGFMKAAAVEPDVADVARLAASSQQARYAEDAGYDLRSLRVAARRLVAPALALGDRATLAYAAEVSAEHALLGGEGDAEPGNGGRLIERPEGPMESAEAFAASGLTVVFLMLSDADLVVLRAEPGLPVDAYVEPPATFSGTAFQKWCRTYPYGYWNPMSENAFRGTMRGLALTTLPVRAAIVAGGDLQQMPPNVLPVAGSYAGLEHRLAVVPSLTWLQASRRAARQGNGKARAWIPVPDGASGTETLALMRDDIVDVLASYNVELECAGSPSVDFATADVVIIGAHGGLAEGRRYFASVSDDLHTQIEVTDLVDVTRNARVAILFVCSGGRLDPHPDTGMAVGLAKQLLANGFQAVMAPSWPIVFNVARPWLKGFLPAWEQGKELIDACFEANRMVALMSSYDPQRCLAMMLYGDPLVRRTTSQGEDSKTAAEP